MHVSTKGGPISTKIFLEFGAGDRGLGGQELGIDARILGLGRELLAEKKDRITGF